MTWRADAGELGFVRIPSGIGLVVGGVRDASCITFNTAIESFGGVMTVTSFTGGETRFVPFISHSVLPSAMELARPLAVSIMEEAGRFDCWAIRPLAAFLDMLGVTEAEASVWGAKAVLDEFETRYDGSFCDLAEWGWGHADAIGEDSPLLRFVDWGQAAESFHEAGWEFVTIPPSPEETPCPRCADHGPLLVFMPLGWK